MDKEGIVESNRGKQGTNERTRMTCKIRCKSRERYGFKSSNEKKVAHEEVLLALVNIF